MSPTLRSSRYTLAPGQEIPFQASECLVITATSGTISLNGSGMNDISPGQLLPEGLKVRGPLQPDGSRMPLGLVSFRNESPTAYGYIEVWTGNGEVEVTRSPGGSAIVQRNGVFRRQAGPWLTSSAAQSVCGLYIPGVSTKRIGLLRIGLQHAGWVAAGLNNYLYLQRAFGFAGGGAMTIAKNDPASVSAATLTAAPPTYTEIGGGVDYLWASPLYAIPTAITPFATPFVFDFTNGGVEEPIWSRPGDTGGGFIIRASNGVVINSMDLLLEWAEA